MSLPRISTSRLQRGVNDAEFPDAAESFDALCETVANTTWAKNLKIAADTVGRLIVAHDIVTKVGIPEAVAEEPVAPKLSKTTARPPASDDTKKKAKKKKTDPVVEDDPPPTVVETVLKGRVKYRPSGMGVMRVRTPAGSCPHKLQGMSLDEVRDWAEKVRDSGFPADSEKGKLYTFHALKYWARSFYDIFGDDYNVVVDHLKSLYPEESQ